MVRGSFVTRMPAVARITGKILLSSSEIDRSNGLVVGSWKLLLTHARDCGRMTGNRKLLAASQMVCGAQLRRKSDAGVLRGRLHDASDRLGRDS